MPALPDAGCTNTFSNPERVSSAETSSAFRAEAAGEAEIAALAGHADRGVFHGALHARRRRARASASGIGSPSFSPRRS